MIFSAQRQRSPGRRFRLLRNSYSVNRRLRCIALLGRFVIRTIKHHVYHNSYWPLFVSDFKYNNLGKVYLQINVLLMHFIFNDVFGDTCDLFWIYRVRLMINDFVLFNFNRYRLHLNINWLIDLEIYILTEIIIL